jgi:MraZ protein
LTRWIVSGINVGSSGGEGSWLVAELLGQHRYQLDAKGRIALPARFREAFIDGVYLTLGQDGGLYAFAREEWERRSGEVRSRPLSGREARDYARMFFANAELAELDGQGRLVIPQRLRGQIGLERDAVVVGVSDHLEIWAGSAWDRYEQAHIGAYVAGSLDPDGH